jgi:hypothetical protein
MNDCFIRGKVIFMGSSRGQLQAAGSKQLYSNNLLSRIYTGFRKVRDYYIYTKKGGLTSLPSTTDKLNAAWYKLVGGHFRPLLLLNPRLSKAILYLIQPDDFSPSFFFLFRLLAVPAPFS